MEYRPIGPIELTEAEMQLYAQIPEDFDHDSWQNTADAMEELMKSLLARSGIPEIRLRVFSDPGCAETGNQSRQSVFESNGTSGRDIFRHGNFVKYLRYFVKGPELPIGVIDGLCKILNDDHGTSGMVLDQYRRYARKCVRDFELDPACAGTEFFRLGLEIGMDLTAARSLREAAKSVR